MIVFHEGLPGSGKSYEACVVHIIPALKAGRRVVTNIEGISHKKFSEITGIPEPIVQSMLKCVFHPEENDVEKRVDLQRKSFIDESGKDALIVIDEIQNLFPSGREKLSSDWMRYITEHRHDGLDIILMGQDRRDCHNVWRRRIQRVITFTKQTALGRDGHYTWVAFEATKPEVYKKISAGSRSYDKKFFGLYASHTSGTKNTDPYKDDRVNIFKGAGFKWGIPAAVVVGFFAVSHLQNFFSPAEASEPEVTAVQYSVPVDKPASGQPVNVSAPPGPAVPEPEPEYQPVDQFDDMANQYRPRLAGVAYAGDKVIAQVDIHDNSYHVKDSYTLAALEDMGWNYEYRPSGLLLTKSDRRYLVRPWPIDKFGKVDRHTTAQL